MSAQTALVTGATGFVGGRLVRRLLGEGWDVATLAPEGEVDLAVDLREPEPVELALRSLAPTVVFHLAAIARGGTDRAGIEEMLSVNIDGTRILTQAMARLGKPPRLISAGSLAEYGSAEGPYKGAPTCGDVSPYGGSKRIVAALARLYAQQSGATAIVIRSCDLYGPSRSGPYFLPSLLRALREGERFAMTTGEQVRDHLFVDDFVDALVLGANVPCEGFGATSVGSGAPTSLIELATRAAALLGKVKDLDVGALPHRPGEPLCMCADVGHIREWLQWKPQHTLDEGLRITVAALQSPTEEHPA